MPAPRTDTPTPARPPRRSRDGRTFAIAAAIAATALLAFLALPVVAVVARVSPAAFARALASREVREALVLSLGTTASSTAIVVLLGTPLAWLLATREPRWRRAVEVLVELPMVLPPTVAGLALLMAFGRAGLAGRALEAFGLRLPFTTLGVVAAQVFMSAPFYVTAARSGFESLDRRLVDVAATLGAGEAFTFARVALPLARPALAGGVALAAARALGEFGATITFAGNLPGTTQTLPLAVYVTLQTDLDTAVVMAVVLLAASLLLLSGVRGLAPARRAGAPAPGPRAAR